jgi:hypothetical protein
MAVYGPFIRRKVTVNGLVANYGTNNIGILFGYGNGSFQDQTTYSTGYDSMPYPIAVGHFNKDNQLDIAVANYGTNNISISILFGQSLVYKLLKQVLMSCCNINILNYRRF